MFDNASDKIKLWAKVVTWIGIAASVIAGIVMISGGSMMTSYLSRNTMIWPGVLTMVFGSLLSWVNGLFIYNFGDIAEHTAAAHEELANLAADQHVQLDMLIRALDAQDKGVEP